MKPLVSQFCTVLLFCSTLLNAAEPELTAEERAYVDEVYRIWDKVEKRQGQISLAGEVATLDIPESFYYLNPQQAEMLLVDLWENPPGAGLDTLGLLIPQNFDPLSAEAYAVTIWYEEDGYVSDDEADEIDYDELLEAMQGSTEAASKQRVQQGYEAIKLIGWAAKPYYDKASHKMYWAKEMEFGGAPGHTLNYNIRVLGRQGVLVLNFIAGMDQLAHINQQLDTVLALADFNQGSRYQDFDPDIDQVAAYGLGALVAGKALAKTGLLAAALVFLKKFGVVIAIAVFAVFGRLFKRKKTTAA